MIKSLKSNCNNFIFKNPESKKVKGPQILRENKATICKHTHTHTHIWHNLIKMAMIKKGRNVTKHSPEYESSPMRSKRRVLS